MSKKQNEDSVEKKKEAARIAEIENDVQIAGCYREKWAVISISGIFRFPDGNYPCVIHSGLETLGAAEAARCDAINTLTERRDGPYGSRKIPSSYYNKVGRVVAKLRAANIEAEDLIGLAVGITEAVDGRNWAGSQSGGPVPAGGDLDDEIPF